MRFGKTIVEAAALTVFVAGCASGPGFAQYRMTAPPPQNGEGRVWFYRPNALGAAVQPAVKLDERVVGKAVPRGFFYADAQPGTHEVSATTEWKHQRPVTVTTNSDSYVRLNMMMGFFVGHVIPEVMAESQATNAMNKLHFAGK